MTDIAFYHLVRSPLEKALPRLLEKTLETGRRAVVMATSPGRVETMNAFLWTYRPDSWLPHGSAQAGDGAGNPAWQPVWLTLEDENPNQADFLFLTDGAVSDHMDDFERCFELFDGNLPEAVSGARSRWKAYKEAGHNVTYWRQSESGGWEEAG